MQANPSKQPVVSVIIPITDDMPEYEKRLGSAKAQTWRKLEIVPISLVSELGFVQSLKNAIAASTGDFISLLLPGANYADDKIAQQMAFIDEFELQDATVFCNYTSIDGKHGKKLPVTLPYCDPTVIFRRIFCGLPIDPSSLLIPRMAALEATMLDEQAMVSAMQAFLLALSLKTNMVGMAQSLVSIKKRLPLTPAEKRDLRKLYATLIPLHIDNHKSVALDADIFSALGEAASARLSEGLPWAAWDLWRAAHKRIKVSRSRGAALQSIFKPTLRSAARKLPLGARRLLRTTVCGPAAGAGVRLDFSAIYRDNGFVGTESLSGAGSSRFQTRYIRHKLPELFRDLNIRCILDIPCGDFHWMRDLDLSGVSYIGADVVEAMVRSNQSRFGNDRQSFSHVDLIAGPLPDADLVFCRDCLVHLPYADALAAIETIRNSNCRWLLTTTFTRETPNEDLDALGWRPLNLTLPPFNLPQPTMILSEKCTENGGLAGDKSLGLWKIGDLKPRNPG